MMFHLYVPCIFHASRVAVFCRHAIMVLVCRQGLSPLKVISANVSHWTGILQPVAVPYLHRLEPNPKDAQWPPPQSQVYHSRKNWVYSGTYARSVRVFCTCYSHWHNHLGVPVTLDNLVWVLECLTEWNHLSHFGWYPFCTNRTPYEGEFNKL